MENKCPMCKSIKQIITNDDPFFVIELQSGYVVVCHHQYYKGYLLFINKKHKNELHDLAISERNVYLLEMSLVAEAVHKAFNPKKINYELLGNTASHLHWHIIPRYEDDINPLEPIWNTDPKLRNAEKYRPSTKEIEAIKNKFLVAYQSIIKSEDIN